MPPPRKKQKTKHAGGYPPLEIPAVRHAGWASLARRITEHTKDLEKGPSAADASGVPGNSDYFGPRFDSQMAGIRNPFEGASSSSTTTASMTSERYSYKANPATGAVKAGQMAPEQREHLGDKHNLENPCSNVTITALVKYTIPSMMNTSMCNISVGDSDPKMEKSGARAQSEGEGEGTGGGAEDEAQENMDTD